MSKIKSVLVVGLMAIIALVTVGYYTSNVSFQDAGASSQITFDSLAFKIEQVSASSTISRTFNVSYTQNGQSQILAWSDICLNGECDNDIATAVSEETSNQLGKEYEVDTSDVSEVYLRVTGDFSNNNGLENAFDASQSINFSVSNTGLVDADGISSTLQFNGTNELVVNLVDSAQGRDATFRVNGQTQTTVNDSGTISDLNIQTVTYGLNVDSSRFVGRISHPPGAPPCGAKCDLLETP